MDFIELARFRITTDRLKILAEF